MKSHDDFDDEITWKELQDGFDAGIMLNYLEKHSPKLVDNFEWVEGFIQGWKDRKKFEQWWIRSRRNTEIRGDYRLGFNISDLMERYELSRTQVYRITQEVRDERMQDVRG